MPASASNSAAASDPKLSVIESSISAPKDPILHRRIEFHLARKPFNPYTAAASSDGDFHLETLNPAPDSLRTPGDASGGPSAPPAKKPEPGSEFFEHGLDPELRSEITFRRIGAGLANLGNTCFLNSVLQCLTYTEPFAAYLQSGKHKSSCHMAGFCALCAIQNHVRNALQSTGKIIQPFHLVKNLRCISRNFRDSRQEDAHEYMVNLLESMHKCCLPSGVSSESPSAYDKSTVHKIFGGRLRSQVKCMQCTYCSNKFDPFLDLSLEIVKADSLCKALAHFTALEELDGGQRQYQCQRCKQKVRAFKQLTVHKAPYVLTIHLKRFGLDIPGQKIDKRVDFGPTLNLKPFVSGPYEGELKYTLYGVLVHAGWNTHSGHYYCFVRTSSGLWYSLDDNRVVQVSEKAVLEQKAYMLFYVLDRKCLPPKKPVDSVCFEKIATNATVNNSVPISNIKSKGAIQNGDTEGSIVASKCAASAAKVHAVSSHLQPTHSPGTILKEHAVNGTSGRQGDAQVALEITKKNILKAPVQERESLPKSSTLVAENGGGASHVKNDICSVTENSLTSPENETHTDNGNPQRSGKDMCLVISQESGSSGPQNFLEKLPTGNNVHENGDIFSADDLPVPLKLNGCVKCPRRSIYMSQKKFHVFLSLRKKKHKRNRRCNPDMRKLSQKDVIRNYMSNDLGTSTSSKNSVFDEVHVQCRKRRRCCICKKVNGCKEEKRTCNDNGNNMIIEGRIPEERSGIHAAVLATDGPLGKCSIIDKNKSGQDKRALVQYEYHMLTRGLNMPTVPRWDDVVRSSEAFEYGNAQSGSIGYLPDEWDEEYDRGKKKKIRNSKLPFGGPNPFQEIATEKARKKMNMSMDQTSAGNRPFRI